MGWNEEALMAMRVVLAVVRGLIGCEREWHGKEAGIRTYGEVALGSCGFALISSHVVGGNTPHVIAAGVVTGIGFLGAGVIIREGGTGVGLTTAASLWATASVGLSTGYGMYAIATLVGILVFLLLAVHHLPGSARLKQRAGTSDGLKGAGQAD